MRSRSYLGIWVFIWKRSRDIHLIIKYPWTKKNLIYIVLRPLNCLAFFLLMFIIDINIYLFKLFLSSSIVNFKLYKNKKKVITKGLSNCDVATRLMGQWRTRTEARTSFRKNFSFFICLFFILKHLVLLTEHLINYYFCCSKHENEYNSSEYNLLRYLKR